MSHIAENRRQHRTDYEPLNHTPLLIIAWRKIGGTPSPVSSQTICRGQQALVYLDQDDKLEPVKVLTAPTVTYDEEKAQLIGSYIELDREMKPILEFTECSPCGSLDIQVGTCDAECRLSLPNPEILHGNGETKNLIIPRGNLEFAVIYGGNSSSRTQLLQNLATDNTPSL
jgi:hypothetical protein